LNNTIKLNSLAPGNNELTFVNNSEAILVLRPDGAIIYKGRVIESDTELVKALRELVGK
jgi:hypothetical protein